MDPLALTIITILAKYGPDLAKAAHDMATKPDPTQADWDAFWELAQIPFDTIVPKKVS